MASERRLIDANAFYAYLEDLRQDYIEEDSQSSDFAAEVIETVQDVYLANAPTVDAVEVVHGQWNPRPYHKINSEGRVIKYCDFYYCSECGKERPITPPYNYCPNCGAKMDSK